MGDSHALNLLSGLDELFKRHGIKGIALFDHGCLFLYGTRAYSKGVPDSGCEQNVSAAYRQIASDRWPVIIAGAYGGYTQAIGPADGEVYDGVGADYMASNSPALRRQPAENSCRRARRRAAQPNLQRRR